MNYSSMCSSAYENGILAVAVSGEIDHHTASGVREQIDTQLYLHRGAKVILDLSEVEFMDSSGLGLILGRYTKAKQLGSELYIIDPAVQVEKILHLAGLEKMIPIKHRNHSENFENPGDCSRTDSIKSVKSAKNTEKEKGTVTEYGKGENKSYEA